MASYPTLWRSLILLAVTGACLVACTPEEPKGRKTRPLGVDCNDQAGAVTLCDVQNEYSALHDQAGLGAEITFPNPLVVTLPPFIVAESPGVTIKAFFVSEGEGGPYRGAMVVGNGSQIDELDLKLGSRVNLQVRIQEIPSTTGKGTETQLQLVGGSVVDGLADTPPPTVVDVNLFADGHTAEPYEGVLVQVKEVQTILYDSGALAIAGTFRLKGDLHVATQFAPHPAGVGETFSSITGFVRFDSDGRWKIFPRTPEDIVASGHPREPQAVRINEIQDPAFGMHHCIAPEECPPLKTDKLIITSGPRVAAKDKEKRATLYFVFAQDPQARDANGEPLPYSGIKLVFPGKDVMGENTPYQMATYGAGLVPDSWRLNTWPQIGDVVEVEGSAQEYFDDTQYSVTRLIPEGEVNIDRQPVSPPVSKVFTGEQALAGLAAGIPAVVGCDSLPGVPPGADTEKWEGVLLELRDVSTILACVPTSTNNTTAPACVLEDFGYYRVTGGVDIGTGLGVFVSKACEASKCTCDGRDGSGRLPQDKRVLGERFTSITGVLDYTYSVFRLNPRSDADVVRAPAQ